MTDDVRGLEPEVETEESDGGDNREFASLDDALRAKNQTIANTAFLRRALGPIAATAYYDRGYIKIVRAEGGPDVRIHRGYTNGLTEQEAAALSNENHVWVSKRTGTWGVDHPDHGRGGGGSTPARPIRRGERCASCGDEMPLNGICDWCG